MAYSGIMVVRGEALGIFSIDNLQRDKYFQVILQSQLLVVGTNGVVHGHSDVCVTSETFRCLDSQDSETLIKDWLPYNKRDLEPVKSDLELNQNDIAITFSIKGVENGTKNAEVMVTAGSRDVDTVCDSMDTEPLHTETGSDLVELGKLRKERDTLSEKLGQRIEQNEDDTNQRVSRKRKTIKADEPKTRKRQNNRAKEAIDRQTSKIKLKRRKYEKKSESDLEEHVQVKTEQVDSDYSKISNNSDTAVLHDSLQIKVDSGLSHGKSYSSNSDTVINRKRIPRKRNGRLKTSKHSTKSAKRRKSVIETVDPKLAYAKRSLEKQNFKDARRKRVDLKDHRDKYRTTVVESLAQKDRGKSFKDKSYQSYECTVCGRFQSTIPEKIRFHIEQHVNGELECKKCGYILSYAKEISRHNKEVHKLDIVSKRVCELCGETAGSFRMWKAHMSKIHKVPSFKCKHCTDKFFNAAEVVTHTRDAHKDIILTCDKCGQVFVSRSNWSYHSVRCSGTTSADSFVCDQCGKDLGSSIMLRRHVRHNHEMEKTQKCSYCSYATHTIARLQKHVNTHLGYKQYHCEHCQFSCVQKYQLTSHMRTHNGVKPFRCDQCPYAVAWNVQLKTHRKVHSLVTAVTCTSCGVVFKDTKTLSKHEQKEHVEKTNIEENGNKNATKDSDNVIGFIPAPAVNNGLSSCINNNFSTIANAEQRHFINVPDTRNIVYGMNGSVPGLNNVITMNVNRSMRSHIGQQNNCQVPMPAEISLFPFSYH